MFIHTLDGQIIVDGDVYATAEFTEFEASYALPDGAFAAEAEVDGSLMLFDGNGHEIFKMADVPEAVESASLDPDTGTLILFDAQGNEVVPTGDEPTKPLQVDRHISEWPGVQAMMGKGDDYRAKKAKKDSDANPGQAARRAIAKGQPMAADDPREQITVGELRDILIERANSHAMRAIRNYYSKDQQLSMLMLAVAGGTPLDADVVSVITPRMDWAATTQTTLIGARTRAQVLAVNIDLPAELA